MYFRFVAMLAEYGITGSLFYPLVKQRVKQKSNKLRLGSDHSQPLTTFFLVSFHLSVMLSFMVVTLLFSI